MKQNHPFVRLFSVALTCLVLGAVGAYLLSSKSFSRKLGDQKFLQTALQRIEPDKKEKPRTRLPALVRVANAAKKPINTVRPFYGRLTEIQLASISTEIAGLVTRLPVEIGQRVEGGKTLIAQIDQTWLKLSVEQSEAEIKILENQFAYHESELERINKIIASRAGTDSELRNQQMLTEQYRQNLEKAKIANREAKEKLRRTTILAPFDGFIVRRIADEGELLAPGATIADVVSVGQIDAVVQVSEQFVNHIRIGDDMPIIIDKLGIKVLGEVHAIVPYDLVTTHSFPVVVRLDDRNGEFKAGMAATALVSITGMSEEIVVSKDAVLEKPDGSTVWVAVEEKQDDGSVVFLAKPVPVQISAQHVDQYGVKPETDEGQKILVAGAKTIIEGAERLTANQQIRILELDPALLENMPPASGHRVIKPQQRIEDAGK